MQSGSVLAEGTTLGGDFVVVRPLGSGGMGAVYVAEQKSTGKLRALKVMHRDIAPNASLQRRFEQEAKVGARIKSGHVVEVVAAGVDGETGLPYLVMELLDGVDLRTQLGRTGPLAVTEVRRVFEQLCHGIAAAHAAGIVHRDLKPENIFLARPNQAGTVASVVKVLDFGIAKLASEAGTQATGAIGSPLWMAPEQTAPGPVTPAADVWALGLIAFELLTGESFWLAAHLPTATPMHLLREIVIEPIPPASERGGGRLPPGFDAWFARCVARDPAARFAEAGALWRALEPLLSSAAGASSASVRPVSTAPEALAATEVALGSEGAPAPRPGAETPLALVSPATPAPARSVAPVDVSPRSSRVIVGVALGLGAAGLLGGFAMARRAQGPTALVATAPPSPPAFVPLAANFPLPPLPVVPVGPPPTPVVAGSVSRPPAVPSPPVVVAPPPPAPVPALLPVAAAAPPVPTPPSPPRAAPRDGFSDPEDGARMSGSGRTSTVMSVQGHNVRLFTRLVSNASNVADGVVRGAVDWSSWEYIRCYQRTFGGAKDLPEGTVRLSFDIMDQLPRHATLEASTFTSAEVAQCVVQTLAGHTMNAARSVGAGHVVYAFKFVVVD